MTALHLFDGDKDKGSDDGDEQSTAIGHSGESGPVLRRTLGLYDGLGVLVGIMIGSGIFASPGVALERCGSPGMSLLVWFGAGTLVMISSFNYMELAAMHPSAGGDFSFIKRAYGDDGAFCFAWYNFWVSKTGSQAIIATIFGQYLTWLVGGGEIGGTSTMSKVFGVTLTVLLAVVNCMGIRESSNLQNVLTVIKLTLIFMVFIAGMVYAMDSPDTLEHNFAGESAFEGTKGFGFFTGMVAALWAFDGWADLNFMAEELIDPVRNIPKVMGGGLMLVTVAYILANVAYLAVLDKGDIAGASAIAIDFGYTTGGEIYGAAAAAVLALGVAVATAGSENGSIMTGGRAFMAVAREGHAPRVFSRLNAAGAPSAALAAQCVWTCVLILLPGSSFSALLDYFGPVSWMFYAITSSCVIKLRWSEPDTPRPFTVPWYPLPPIITAVVAVCIMVSSLVTKPLFTSLALGFCGLALPVRWLVKSLREPAPQGGGGRPWSKVNEGEVGDETGTELTGRDMDVLSGLQSGLEEEHEHDGTDQSAPLSAV
jgi:amino acid transporter